MGKGDNHEDRQMDTDQSPHSLQESIDSRRGGCGGSSRDSITNEDSRDSIRSAEEDILASLETENSNTTANLDNDDSSSSSTSLRKPQELGSLSREASFGVSDQVSGRSSATPGGDEEEREYEGGGRDGSSDLPCRQGGRGEGEKAFQTGGRKS